jgi:transposase
MAAPIALRDDFDGPGLRRLAKATKDAAQARRLLALAEIYDGGSRTDAARIGGVTLQIVRDWGVRFNQHGPDRLINRTAPGNRPKLNEDQRLALARMVESGPIPAIHGVVRWRRKDLACWLFDEFRIAVDETTVGRALRALGDEFRIAVDETTVGRALRALGDEFRIAVDETTVGRALRALGDEFRIAVDETTVGRALRALGDEFRIAVDETTVGRALRALGFAKLSARPRHYAQNEREREAFKKACPPSWRRSEPGCQTAPR